MISDEELAPWELALQAELEGLVNRFTEDRRPSGKFSGTTDFVERLSNVERVVLNLRAPEEHLGVGVSARYRNDHEAFRNDLASYSRLHTLSRVGIPPFRETIAFTDPLLAFAAADSTMISLFSIECVFLDAERWAGDDTVGIVQNLLHAILTDQTDKPGLGSWKPTSRTDQALVGALTAIWQADAVGLEMALAALVSAHRRTGWIRDRYRGLGSVPILAIGLCALADQRQIPVTISAGEPWIRDYLNWLAERTGPPRVRAYSGNASLLNPLVLNPSIEVPQLRSRFAEAWALKN